MTDLLAQIEKLPLIEQLALAESIWKRVSGQKEPRESEAWYFEEAKRRSAEIKANPEIGITLEELWKRVDDLDS